MALDINKVADSASTTPANSEETSGLPTEILELPIFAGLLAGAPAALYTKTGDKSVEATTAVKHGAKLNEVGIFFLRDKPSGLDLIYNAQFISPEIVETAAKKGKLESIASPLAETVAQFNGTGAATDGGATLSSSGMPSSVPVDGSLTTARKDNLEPGSPTSGPSPGAGRVLNSIQKQAI